MNAVLGFYGYDDDVKDLMQVLSTGSREYIRAHWVSMVDHLTHWPLPTTGLVEFGDNKWNWDPEYPTTEQMKDFSKTKQIKWSGVRYKQNNNIS